ncbi:hypothetical protein OPS25_05440 [Alteromonas ponticola]|uniref:Uncharacterized protein n=1 Tax=Alteromonas aquimaris TaxID=2998417 RepID=A0ABT3P592_9ALTE|nr:hypothetical protein [Alteromonas aquimaris]MCW8107936.1 hypothetical protein [Alteromonas aquimaris]
MRNIKPNQPMLLKLLILTAAFILFTTSSLPALADGATNQNSVEVKLVPSADNPADLILYMGNEKIEVIDFPKGKKFIQFAFPAEYSNYSIRVFEMNEVADKTRIMDLYKTNPAQGIEAFDKQWEGKASSQQKGHEFNLREPKNHNMVLQNLNRDGTREGTLHDYILKFTVNGKTYLHDPQIRNRD